ncbi:4-hydroxythreonine-4-phosphate dehydrogenase [Helicobacter sp. MIT 05-5293]|uniref:4-hydroxythreonine-4-phosphate dehydrogenase n=1 Tax=Helicobacter sp. MIT 05-5293 TaxID=1548149 RepID=UPI00051D82EF|nr:4-hydroxythreonine-4-phosphate dehydrogenase [Helicobacter sp. MIT 05-5293]TLD81580.1 4-hydroxythreonine-4-phosphate dehydrogenase [Helicobacter sp. MIT 05-5293]
MSKIAISIGDINGVGIEIALRAHKDIAQWCEPIYCVHSEILESALALLGKEEVFDSVLRSMCFSPPAVGFLENLRIQAGEISALSGAYSYESFMQAVRLAQDSQCDAIVTLPIHKKAWQLGGVPYVGHTEALGAYFGVHSIMMLGCESMFVALFSDHIALKEVSPLVKDSDVRDFLVCFARSVCLNEPCCVLGLNPHCGDGGLMGNEDEEICRAIKEANKILKKDLFFGAYPPDSAFSPLNRERFRYFVSMYHDVGLAPLKALYFEESINVSLNLPILRTSVDHGVAYDKAYKNDASLSLTSYFNAVKYALKHQKNKKDFL